jgi:UDP-N-acetyl-2-amino-2-deoxyglucuronate dehydrogenase
MSIGFGIVGCGMISRFHCRALAEVSGARFVGCVSQRKESAEELASRFSGRAYPDLAAMLADPAIQVVSICTPSGAHLEPAVAAAEAGKNVIVEKPLEITLQRCDALIRACEQNGVRLGAIFPSRFHQASQILKRGVDSGKFGKLTLGDAYVKWYRTQEYYDSGNWRGTWALDGGGALMNQAIHSVDLLSWLMGPVAEITAQVGLLAHERIEVEDTAVATLRFANGALGVIEATTAAYPGAHKKIEIHGTLGSAAIEEEDIKVWSFKEMTEEDRRMLTLFSETTRTGGGAADPAAIGHAAHAAQFQDFVDSLKRGTAPAIDGAEGRKSVEIILGIYQAARLGNAVTLPLTA